MRAWLWVQHEARDLAQKRSCRVMVGPLTSRKQVKQRLWAPEPSSQALATRKAALPGESWPEGRPCLECFRNEKETSVAGAEWGDYSQTDNGDTWYGSLKTTLRTLLFSPCLESIAMFWAEAWYGLTQHFLRYGLGTPGSPWNLLGILMKSKYFPSIIRYNLPFSFLSSHEQTVEFSRGCMVYNV